MQPSPSIRLDASASALSFQSKFDSLLQVGAFRLFPEWQELIYDGLPFGSRRDAALALATDVARNWSHPDKGEVVFPLARRGAVVGRTTLFERLGLSEDRLRQAIVDIQSVGIVERTSSEAPRCRRRKDGRIRRDPVLFRVGAAARDAAWGAWRKAREAFERLMESAGWLRNKVGTPNKQGRTLSASLVIGGRLTEPPREGLPEAEFPERSAEEMARRRRFVDETLAASRRRAAAAALEAAHEREARLLADEKRIFSQPSLVKSRSSAAPPEPSGFGHLLNSKFLGGGGR